VYLILIFGIIPTMSMILWMKGHNRISPCRMCEIVALWIPNSCATTHYVPPDHSCHPHVQADAIQVYDPENLPLCKHDTFLSQANEV
jgi:hypothetical protein